MEPQTPQTIPPEPDQTPIIQKTIVSPPNKHSRKKLILSVVLGIVILTIGAAILFGGSKSNDSPKQAQNTTDGNNTTTGTILIGSKRYVNACQILPPQDQEKYFALLSSSALVTATNAEGSIAAKDVTTSGIISRCSRQFDRNGPYSGTVMLVTTNQFASDAAAKEQYKTITLSEEQVKKTNQDEGLNFSGGTQPLVGAPNNTLYDPTHDISYTLVGNTIINFSAILGSGGVNRASFQQSIIAALPAAIANVQKADLSQRMDADSAFGKSIGESTYLQPCEFFTAKDFYKVAGAVDDPMNVQITYHHAATDHLNTNISSGYSYNTCERVAPRKQETDVTIQYFKTANEAKTSLAARMDKLQTGDYNNTVTKVSGLGDSAYYRKDNDVGAGFMEVQKGPYVLEIQTQDLSTSSPKRTPTPQSKYLAAAKLLVAKLPH
jgi:hypothetical protein